MASVAPPFSPQPDAATQTPVAGWYQDPSGPGLRWWNGSSWTDFTESALEEADGESSVEGTDAQARAVASLPGIRSASRSRDEGLGRYRLPVLVTVLAVAALIGGAVLIGGGEDESTGQIVPEEIVDGPAPAAAAPPPPSAAETARSAQTAIETFSVDNAGSYAGATAPDLVAIEQSLDVAELSVTSDDTSYTVSVADSAGVTFSTSRDSSGAISFSCQPAGMSDCPADGVWSP